MEKEDIYIVLILLVASFIALTVGLITSNQYLSIGGIILGGLGLILKRIKVSCPNCGASVRLSEAIDSMDKEITCKICKEKINRY